MAAEVATNPPVADKEVKEEAPQDNGQPPADEPTPPPPDKAEEAASPPAKPDPAPPKLAVHKPNFEKDIVYLYQFSRTPLLPSLSPYCFKVETWLRLAGLKYENVDHKMKFRSTKGQLPFVELNGEQIADSALIIKDLSQKFNKDLDAGLTAEQRNVAHAMISMIENHLLWVVFWWRAKYPDSVIKGYKVNLQHALGTRIPNSILNFLFKFSYGRKGSKKVKAQGIGVHKPEEIAEFGNNDLRVLSDILADKPFFFGDEPTNLDVVAFANLAQIHFIDSEISYGLRDYMSTECPNLVGHVSRMKERCFPDWDDICTTLDLNSHLPKPVKDVKEGKEGTGPAEKPIPVTDADLEKEKLNEKEAEKDTEENKEKEKENENEKEKDKESK